jgi:formate dehydrogenase subunit gamma
MATTAPSELLMTTVSATDRVALVRAIAAQHVGERGPLMPVLHAVVEELGHIAREDVEAVADVLNLSVAEVHGVVSFYHDFRTDPPAAHTVSLCRGEACQSVGAEALYADTHARADSLGEDVEVAEVFCLGNCALGPSGMVDGRLYGRLDAERIDALTEGWR